MASSMSQGSLEIIKRYADSLLDLCEESNKVSPVQSDLQSIQALYNDNEDFRSTVTNPILSRGALKEFVSSFCKGTKPDEITQNFLGVLAENRRLSLLSEIITQFLKRVSEKNGEVPVQIISAKELSKKQESHLTDSLKKMMGQKLSVQKSTDPSLIGGFILVINSRMYDASVKTMMDKLKISLRESK